MLEIGKALMIDPQIILFDEPTAGLAPIVSNLIFEEVEKLRRAKRTLLMVEQNAKEGLKLSDRGYVLAMGKKRFEDEGQALLNNPDVGRLYLGD